MVERAERLDLVHDACEERQCLLFALNLELIATQGWRRSARSLRGIAGLRRQSKRSAPEVRSARHLPRRLPHL